ncbi:MAG: hypothetical protein ACP5OY_03850, partial [Halothiobacillaceae bacterium]
KTGQPSCYKSGQFICSLHGQVGQVARLDELMENAKNFVPSGLRLPAIPGPPRRGKISLSQHV